MQPLRHSHLPHNGPIPTLRIPEMSITRHRPTSTTTRSRDGTIKTSQATSPNFTQDHTIASPSRPRRRGTYRTYQVVPRTLLQPSCLYQSSWIGLCVFWSECRTRSYLVMGKPGALVLTAVWVRCTRRIRSSALSTKEHTLQLQVLMLQSFPWKGRI